MDEKNGIDFILTRIVLWFSFQYFFLLEFRISFFSPNMDTSLLPFKQFIALQKRDKIEADKQEAKRS